jgi:ribosome maturation protein Sdo1
MEGKRKGVQVRCEKSSERRTENVMKRFDEVEPIKVNKTRIVKSITTGKSQ